MQATGASLSISWQRVRSAAGYDTYLDGARVAKTQGTAYTFANLRCGAAYTLGVDAFTIKGVDSSVVSVVARTSACPVAVGGNDTSPPTSPTSLTQGATAATTISLLWSASLDNVAVAGYDVFLNGNKVGTTAATSYSFANLSCGTSYTLAVDAYDAAGNRSQSAAVQASTSPCPDTSPPTIPALPTQSGSTATTISLLWSASLDNVAVAGYDVFLNGNKVGTTAATSYSFANLSCGTSYTLAVDAYDAAGNRSQRASLGAATAACASPSVNCDKVVAPGGSDSNPGTLAAPYQTAQKLANSLSAGQTGCLRGGTYADPADGNRVILFNLKSGTASAPITVTSYPGETATLCGYIETRPASSYITVSHVLIDGSCSTQQKVQVFSDNFTLKYSEVDGHQAGTGSSCVFLGDSTFGVAHNALIDHNRLHDCATNAYGHGIYDDNTVGAVITNNVIYDNGGFGIQLYPNSQGTLFANNVVDGSKTEAGLLFAGTSDNNTVRDNIFSFNATYGVDASWGNSVGTGNVASHNCFYGNVSGAIGSTTGWADQGSNVLASPLYADPANDNYTLQPSSPCAGMGPN
jgi:parallel beta-helix repeat protein